MFQSLHAPSTFAEIDRARQRIYTTKLLQRQLNAQIAKQQYQHILSTTPPERHWVSDLLEHVPFELTGAQKKAIKQIIEEMHGPVTMMKLLQGDVGSGKTIVAAVAARYVLKQW